MAKLNSITVQGYKSIKKIDNFHLNSLNILIGANGAGKSNFVGIFDFIHKIVSQELKKTVLIAGGADTYLHYGRRKTEKIELVLEFATNGDASNSYEIILTPAQNRLIIEHEKVSFHDKRKYDKPYEVKIGELLEESVLKASTLKAQDTQQKVAYYVLKAISSWRVYHFHDTSIDSKMKQLCPIGDNDFLREDASNLAAILFLLKKKHKKDYDNIVEVIREVAPFFNDFKLRPWLDCPDKIKLEWEEKGSDAYFDAYSLSDGTLRFICLAVLLLQPKLPDTILLDEPEIGLHPYAINKLAGLLKSSSHRTQIIVSTQSVALVNQFIPEDIIIVDREKGKTIFRRLSKEAILSWVDEYGLGDLWERNIIGGMPEW